MKVWGFVMHGWGGVECVMQGWGVSCRGGLGHEGVGWVMEGWGGSCCVGG